MLASLAMKPDDIDVSPRILAGAALLLHVGLLVWHLYPWQVQRCFCVWSTRAMHCASGCDTICLTPGRCCASSACGTKGQCRFCACPECDNIGLTSRSLAGAALLLRVGRSAQPVRGPAALPPALLPGGCHRGGAGDQREQLGAGQLPGVPAPRPPAQGASSAQRVG